jgi:predicted deacylase
MKTWGILFCLLLLGGLAACAAPRPVADTHCRSGPVLLDAQFDGGQMGLCRAGAAGEFDLTLFPEDAPPVNRSPWFAYRVSGRAGEAVAIRMTFQDGYARYWPKSSPDGENWRPLPEDQVRIVANDVMEISLVLDRGRVWVSAQEILGYDYYRGWMNDLEAHEALETRLVSQSTRGRPLYLAETADRPEIILMMGRQHPPEVSGALAMRRFIDVVLSDTALARDFRERFKLAIIPLVNPDGVADGHWRHGDGGVDLNRDWGPFTQPETRGIRAWLDTQEAAGMRVRLLIDFHSTWEDLFYTQLAEKELDPPGFTTQWLTAAAERLPDFPFKHDARELSDQPNAKNYFFATYGIAAVTYEVGDETPRDRAEQAAVVFAEEMMKAMLAAKAP